MKRSAFSRYALGSCVAAAMLAGCGGSQPPIGAPGAVPQNTVTLAGPFRSGLLIRKASLAFPALTQGAQRYKVTEPLLYVANFGDTDVGGYVTVYDAAVNDPKPLATITNEVTVPAGDCIDGDGTLYVVNDGFNSTGWVSEYPLGRTTTTKIITDGINGPAFCAIDSRGNLWVTNINLNNVTEYLKGSSKPHTTITNGLTYADGIAIDRLGYIYVGNLGFEDGVYNVQVYPPGKKSPSRTITDGITWPVGITVDASGTLYVANLASCNIEEYRSGQGKPFREITGTNFGPVNATVNKRGRLFVADLPGAACTKDSASSAILEFRPNSIKPLAREITSNLEVPEGLAYYPPLLP